MNIAIVGTGYVGLVSADRHPQRPELWDGKTAMRCVEAIVACSL